MMEVSSQASAQTLNFTCETVSGSNTQIGDSQSNIPQSTESAITAAQAVIDAAGKDLALEDAFKVVNNEENCTEGTWTLTDPPTDVCAIGIHAGNGFSIFEIDPEASSGVWQSPPRTNKQGKEQAPADLSNLFAFTCTDNGGGTDNFASLEIEKQFDSDSDREFLLEITGAGLPTPLQVSLKDDETETVQINLGNLTSGTVTLEELTQTGLENPDISCTLDETVVENGSGGFSLSNIPVEADKTTSCVVTNEADVPDPQENIIQISLQKVTDKAGEFTVNVDGVNGVTFSGSKTFDLGAGETSEQKIVEIEAGDNVWDFIVTENDPGEGFLDPVISCSITSQGENGETASADKGSLTNLEGGDTAACVVENRGVPEATLELVKVVEGGVAVSSDFDLTFGIDGSFQTVNSGHVEQISFDDDNAKPVVLSESGGPGGYDLTSISCDNGESVTFEEGGGLSGTLSFDIQPDQNVSCTYTNRFDDVDEEMEEEVEKFNETTLKLLLTHGPDRARLVRRLQEEQPLSLKDTSPLPPLKMSGEMGPEGMQGSFSMSLSGLRASMMAEDARKIRKAQDGDGMTSSFADDPYIAPYMMTRPGWDLWIEGQISRYSDDSAGRDRDGTFSILYVGADYAVAPGVIVGALVQVDHTDQDIDGDVWGEIEGTGWMVGPYFGAKIGDNLIFDARAAWGQSDNDIELESDDGGHRTGDFDMERWLVTGKLTGMYYYDGWRISPHVGVAWGTQDQDAFTNSLGQRVGSSSVTLGQLTFGPEFGYTKRLESGATLEPHLAVEGIWNFDGNEIDFATGTESTDDFRAKVEGGFIYATPDGYKFRAAGSYDGIGGDDFEAWSAKAWLNIPLDNGYAAID
ncbi:autotransporter domain-containing protein [Dichotomicrobium thermohalophilum]|nr:autotransporter domain-containing protein [Dichotomicrobium thermohalophilum]